MSVVNLNLLSTFMLATLTLKQKILATVTLAVVVSCLLVGYFSQRSAQQLIENRMFEQELPNLTQRISKEIEQDLHGIAQAARQLATDRFILDWVDRGMPKEQEPILINQLKDVANQYGLVTASFADRQTAAYYNQDGFLRNLTPTQDAWFYDYTKSQKEMTLSIFRESNGEVKLFVNFQQLNGRGLAGFAKSLDTMVTMVSNFRLEESGIVFMVDGSGKVKLHPEANRIERDDRTQIARLTGNARMRRLVGTQLADEVRGDTIVYNDLTEVYNVAGGPSTGAGGAAAGAVPAGRVRAVINPVGQSGGKSALPMPATRAASKGARAASAPVTTLRSSATIGGRP